MKWIGQNIYDLVSKFRNDVLVEGDLRIGGANSTSDNWITLDAYNGSDVSGAGLTFWETSGGSYPHAPQYGAKIVYNEDDDEFSLGTMQNSVYKKQITMARNSSVVEFAGAILVPTDSKLVFRDDNSFINSPTANDLEIAATDITLDAAGTIFLESDATTFTSPNANDPILQIKNTANDATSGRLRFISARGEDGEDGDSIGRITFYGYDDGTPDAEQYAEIQSTIHDATNDEESGKISLKVAAHDGDLEDGLVITGGDTNTEVDVVIGNGAASLTTVAGTLTMGSTAAMTNAGLLSVGNQSNITGLGIISSGDWRGTTIKTAYIADDAVTAAKVAADAIVNASIASNAAIAHTKLAALAATKVLVGNGSNVATEVALSGDVTMDNAGAVTIANTAVTNAMIGDGAVDTEEIADDAVTEDKLANTLLAEIDANTVKNSAPNIFAQYIKLLISDFATNKDGGNTKHGIGFDETVTDVNGDAYDQAYGIKVPNNATELYAFVSIPRGKTATHVEVFDRGDNLAFEVFEVQINAATMVSKGTGNCNTINNIDDVVATETNQLAIKVTTVSVNNRVWGGRVTIA